MINLRNITLQRDNKILLEKAELTLFAKQKIGLVGANGAGKSSLFALFRGELDASHGDINFPTHMRIGHLQQETPALDCSAIDYTVAGDEALAKVKAEMSAAENSGDMERLAELYGDYADLDGYSAEARAAKILDGLGFSDEEMQRAVKEFSGGWRMRLNIARCLLQAPDLLLLDEPTNHLDLETIIWLERWLKNFVGTLIIISHDRDFLDSVVDHVIHIHGQKLKLYKGNYSAFEELRAEMLANQAAQYKKQQTNIAHMQKYVDRFRFKASKAKQAQSRIKAIARMDKVAPVLAENPYHFSFTEAARYPNHLLRFENVDLGYDDNKILKRINLNIMAESRIGILGVNGAGKTTLLKALAEKLAPMNGQVHRHKDLRIGYFTQHQVDELDLEEHAFWHLQQIGGRASGQDLRNFLGRFNFSGDMAALPVGKLSGGEKARLALAMLVWQQPNLLLLDEPTNHFDLEMRQALTEALLGFQGALLLVSHDRHLISSVVGELWLLNNNKIEIFKGDMHDYRQLILEKK